MRCVVGCEPADRHGERTDAAGSVGTRKGVPADFATPLPADGSAGGSEYPGDNFRQKEPCPRLLPVLAEIKNLAD